MSELEKIYGRLRSSFFTWVLNWEERKWVNDCFVLNFSSPHADMLVREKLHNCGVLCWGLNMTFYMHSIIYYILGVKTFLSNCALQWHRDWWHCNPCKMCLEVYLQTFKQRHSIRVWRWEIWWCLKWINTLGVERWPSAKETGTTDVSSSGHQGWVVSPLFKAEDSSYKSGHYGTLHNAHSVFCSP